MPKEVSFFVVPRYRDLLGGCGLVNLEACLAFEGGEVVKSAVPGRETLRFTCGDETFYMKRIQGRGWRDVFNEARLLGRLHEKGLPVPEPVAFGLRMRRGVLLTRALPEGRTLEEIVVHGNPDREELSRLAREAAALVRKLHDHGVNHRDLYLGHVLVGGDGNLYLVDLGRAEKRVRVPRRRVVKDLAALDFSTPGRVADDTLRREFLETYLGPAATPRRLRRLAAAVRRKSTMIRRHAERKVARGEGNVHINT